MQKTIFGALLSFFLIHCATVNRGPTQSIRVGSKPSGAHVILSGCGVGSTESATTPAIVQVNRRATSCTLTLTLEDYGARTVSLLRTGRAMGRTGPPDALLDPLPGADADPVDDFIEAMVLGVGLPIWGMSRAFDGLTGANYQQHRSTVLIDFTEPAREVAGQYAVVAVNGTELPAKSWTDEDGKCEIWTNGGSLLLERTGRWTSMVREQRVCGTRKRPPVESTSYGVYTIHGARILLESEGGVASGVFLDDRLELKMIGEEGQSAVYTLRVPSAEERRER